jgi:hypothetical protein
MFYRSKIAAWGTVGGTLWAGEGGISNHLNSLSRTFDSVPGTIIQHLDAKSLTLAFPPG